MLLLTVLKWFMWSVIKMDWVIAGVIKIDFEIPWEGGNAHQVGEESRL